MILKTCALETIDSYPATAIHVYTDGSAFKATKNAGYGILLRYPDGSVYEHCDSCGENCSNYEAEVKAIQTTTQLIHQHLNLGEKNPADIVIFSDSKSALDALQNPPYARKEIAHLSQEISNLLTAYDIQITLQWIPGHSDIKGNENADRLAKSGAAKLQKCTPCSLTTTKQILRQNQKEDWLNRWACGTTGRAFFKEMPKPKPTDNTNKLNRQNQSLIFQFRTQHAKTNAHLNRINPSHEPHCRHCCYPYETTEHLLFQCPSLLNHRKHLLPPNPSTHNTLYGSLAQLRRTSKFIRMSLAAQE